MKAKEMKKEKKLNVKEMKVGYEEVGYKMYYYIHDICESLELGIDDAYEILSMKGYKEWHVTSVGELMVESNGYILLLNHKGSKDHSTLRSELITTIQEEKFYVQAMELFEQKRVIEEKLKSIDMFMEVFDQLTFK